jgi:hypothetical protein
MNSWCRYCTRDIGLDKSGRGENSASKLYVDNLPSSSCAVDVVNWAGFGIEDCDSAIVIWTDNSGVIAKNLELLKNLGKPAFL